MLPTPSADASHHASAAMQTFLQPLIGRKAKIHSSSLQFQYHASYNCFSMVKCSRWLDVLQELGHCKVVALQGTRMRQFNKLALHVSHFEGFTIFSSGYEHGSNSHAGVAVCINNSMVPINCIHSICIPEGKFAGLQGRCLAVRTRSNACDQLHVNLYFPLVSARNAAQTCRKMLEWLAELFRNIQVRTYPVLYMDANSQFSFCDGEHVESPTLGQYGREEENEMGTMIRHFSEEWDIVLPFTHRQLPPTFHSVTNLGRNTRTDQIAIAKSVFVELKPKAHVWQKSGRMIQLIKSQCLADHLPIALSMPSCTYMSMPGKQEAADRDAIMLCLLLGRRRHEFLARVESNTIDAQENLENAYSLKSPTAMYCIISQILSQSMLQIFPACKSVLDSEAIRIVKERKKVGYGGAQKTQIRHVA